jgi:PAS domain S-box-containing protein
MKNAVNQGILRIVLPYVVFAGLWILLSDRLLAALVSDADTRTLWSIYKGLAFVIVTAALLASLLRMELMAREKTQNALRESEERLRLLGDNLPDSYVYQYLHDPKGASRFIYLSAGVEKLNGVKVSDALKDPGVLHRQIASEHFAALRAGEATSFRTMTDFEMEVRMKRADGQWRWMQIRSRPRPRPDGQVIWDGVVTDITARKQADEAVLLANRQLMSIIEFLPDATFVIDHDKRIVAWNRACEVMTGVMKKAVMGRGDYAYAEPFFGKRRPVLMDLLDQPSAEVEAHYTHVWKSGDMIFAEGFLPLLRGGRGAHIWGVAAPLFDPEGRRCGAIEVVRDVTDEKLTEQALHDSERKYRELVEQANSIILRWNSDGRINFLNKFGQKFFGFSAEEIIGRHVMGTIVPATDSNGRDMRGLMEQICSDPVAFEQNVNENIRHNGERVWIAWTNRIVLDAEGQVSEIFSVGADITELKRAEETIRELNASLELRVLERTAQLEAANKDLESFTYSVSHDLRAPLRSINGFVSILLENYGGKLDDEGKRICAVISKNTRNMSLLIDDLLAFSRVGRAALHPALLNMESLVNSLFQELTTPESRQRIDFHAASMPPVVGDPVLMRQVWVNLLGNAIKYSSKKERAVIEVGAMTMAEYDARPVVAPTADPAWASMDTPQQPAAPMDPAQIVYFVRDNGVGFNMRYAQKLFNVFQRLHSDSEFEGTGVGLAIVQRIVQLHAGRVWAEAEPDKGATFFLSMQAAE